MQDFAGLKADKGLSTASIPATPGAADANVAGDSRAITEALARAESSDSEGLKWENPDSGAHGLITSFADKKEDGGNCLAFETTRENFDGVHLYQGLACKDPKGVLRLRELEAL